MLAADYPFLDLFWTMLIFFLWILWIWLLFTIFGDIFRRHDISGWMTERNLERTRAQREQLDDYVRQTAGSGGAAAEIDKAKQLLDSGAITQAEFEALKQKALA